MTILEDDGMGRPLRVELEGAVYHITSRGSVRESIFIDIEDKKRFLAILEDYHNRFGAIYHCFVLMNNHYHLLLETPHGNLVSIMHGINSSYTGYFNRKYNRVGHLFQGRYKAILVEKETYLLELNRYIHLNPVRARICEMPENYDWSSYRGYLYPQERLRWIEYDWTLQQFHEDMWKAIVRYKTFVEEGTSEEISSPLKDAVSGVILGSKNFVDKLKPYLKERINSKEIVRRKELKGFVPSEVIIKKVAESYRVPIENLSKRGKRNLPRKVALYLLHKRSGLPNREIASLFGDIHYTTVSQTVRRLKNEMAKEPKLLKEVARIEKSL